MKKQIASNIPQKMIQTKLYSMIHKKIDSYLEKKEVNKQQKNQTQKQININKSNIIRKQTQILSDISAQQSQKNKIQKTTLGINLLFYQNKIPSQPHGQYIDKMHQKWYKDYQKLERQHTFIQWIFPNTFQSRFNSHARPLTQEEAKQFRINPNIYARYVISYEMMLSFYGIKLKNKKTGQLVRSRHPDYKQRFYKTLLTSFHNHMRITRILCSLTQTGFGRYALQLCKFLKSQIYQPNGGLKMLQKYNIYNKQWKAFQNYVQTSEDINEYFTKYLKDKVNTNLIDLQKQQIEKLKNKQKQIKNAQQQKDIQQKQK